MSLTKIAKAKIELLKRQAWDDFFIFAKYVCGQDLMEETVHREVCEFLTYGLEKSTQLDLKFTPPNKFNDIENVSEGLYKKLVMLHRGAFKSSVAKALMIWLLWHNQNLRIMLDSETLSNAKLYLASVKDLLENHDMVKLICTDKDGTYLLEPNRKIAGGFTEDKIILLHRTKVGMKEPTIFCAGVDNAQTGMHPDVIIMDDLVSERNVGTDTQILKVNDHYKFSLSLLEPDGLHLVIGTRYHMADLYGELIAQKNFDTLIRPAINDDGTVYFPQRFDRKRLEDLKKEQGSYIFSCQYMLNPIDDSESTFKREQFRYFDELPKTIKNRYILIDLAISQKETADFTVIMRIEEDITGDLYIDKYIRDRMLPNVFLESLFIMIMETKGLTSVGIETVAFQKAMFYFIKDEAKKRGIYVNLKELKADKDKIRRIRAMEPLFENRRVYMRRGMDSLERELLEFPYSRHDDVIDTLAYAPQIIKIGKLANKKRMYCYPEADHTGY